MILTDVFEDEGVYFSSRYKDVPRSQTSKHLARITNDTSCSRYWKLKNILIEHIVKRLNYELTAWRVLLEIYIIQWSYKKNHT